MKRFFSQLITLGVVVTSALMIWKGLMCFAGSESPVVVVLTGSMEPGFKRGDILFLHMNKDPIRAGEIVVYNVDGRDIPIVHRVIEVRLFFFDLLFYFKEDNSTILVQLDLRMLHVHERKDTGDVYILTKANRHLIESSGDNNPVDDISLYPQGQFWLERHHIIGRAVGYLPHVGWVTIIMTEKPIIKYLLIGALGLLVLSSKE
uniref:Signal peptidase complex catalytic subunit SEC11 n=1 Tax=Ananas comosus var. bracteatus TaxID=296719 RepID=A0A6V7QMM6_ANACO|nr:unnamed protein product [Ananas comosus var. bracteatus]